MPAISYRKLDQNFDPVFGGGQNSFVADVQAVAQAIETRLKLIKGEWWEDTLQGLALFNWFGYPQGPTVLGASNPRKNVEIIALMIQNVILGTPFVKGISNLECGFTPSTRAFFFSCYVQTQFGGLALAIRP